jgi:hypothetical protein
MSVPHNAPQFADVLSRAREARAARERAEREWAAARDELRATAEAGTLPTDVQSEVDQLLHEGEPSHPQHRRWRPSPS